MFILLVFSCVIAGWLYLKWSTSKYLHLSSPGPCLPIIGHSYKLFSKAVLADPATGMWNLYRKHNKDGIMYMNTFSIDTVMVGDFRTLKAIFNNPDATGRTTPGMKKLVLRTRKVSGSEVPGVLLSEGDIWHQQRRFTLRTLRDFGFGKKGMEEMIQEEVIQFKSFLEGISDEPIDFANKLNLPILNALWRVTVGERFEYDDPKLRDIVSRLTHTFKIFGEPAQALLLAFPWLERVDRLWPELFKFEYAARCLEDIVDMMAANITRHQNTLDTNAPRDFIDMMLIEIQNTTDPTSTFYGQLGLDNLKVTLFDLFLAGSETTSTTLTWAVLYMVRYPGVQAGVQRELARVVGEDRLPAMSDKHRLPYTEAVVMEIQRHANIVPLGAQHITLRDISVRGQLLPANTVVTPVMAEVLKGDHHWGDGAVFRPERFLDGAGAVRREEHFVPFSVGRRQCLGETLARTELFLFFTALLQHFTLLPAVPGQLPTEEAVMGVTSLPKPFEVRLTKRVA